jgi:hypothetical protein
MGKLRSPGVFSVPIDPYEVGQIRMDIKRMVLVRLLAEIYKSGDGPSYWWSVEPLLEGDNYLLQPGNIGDDAYNAMEVLAWASK